MEPSNSCWVSRFFIILLTFLLNPSPSSSWSLHPSHIHSMATHRNHTAISDFRLLNRRTLMECSNVTDPSIKIKVSRKSNLVDEEYLTVTVSRVLHPSETDWVAMISPSHSNVESCQDYSYGYIQTGDFDDLPLLCHYPVKAMFVSKDPDYLSCKKKHHKKSRKSKSVVTSCTGKLTFHVINIRTDIEFVFFGGGFDTPCVLARSHRINFVNPKKPLYGHISSIDSTGTSMRLTWVSGDMEPQQVQYGDGNTLPSQVTTFTQDHMCSSSSPSPAKDFGWHDPGYIHSAVMTGLEPSSTFSYKYGSDSAGWSEQIQSRTPPAGGSDELRFIAYGDMGKAPRDASAEHFIQPGSLSVTDAIADEVDSNKVDSIFHIGDISYATGFLVEWDFFLQQIGFVASRVSYMTAIGNHERDYDDSGSIYTLTDSGGECGIPYETYFPMPTSGKDKPWYSIEQGSVHFTVISTEHNWTQNSEQYEWMKNDMASVDRSKTPWLVFTGHRPMYSSGEGYLNVDDQFTKEVEPLLLENKVDLVLFGHVHNYERSCSVFQKECKASPKKDESGIDVYDHNNYSAPVHAIIGMGGFSFDKFPNQVQLYQVQQRTLGGMTQGTFILW
ncbi:probable inactive purple acid phosphatase 27 [Corylus avellana]|uniref:probable inactive purple acid phosphatase 27 n=1 Tax=Corylus avellana TaxID=13451 RepID=UPI00286BA9BA|nr:probable inactive purple acid phosphatase 27 [Corylus avellana]